MALLDDYFTDIRIVRYLCRKRLAATLENRLEGFLGGLTASHELANAPELQRVLPSRQHWPRPGRKQRAASTDPMRDRSELLARSVLELLHSSKTYRWLGRLRDLLEHVKSRALSWTSSAAYTPREIRPIPKTAPGNGQKYRILALYNLENSVLGSGFAAYMRDRLEPHLGPECVAFRAGRGAPPPTHHDGAKQVRQYGLSIPEPGSIWVAECDIAGFFDAISHATVLAASTAVALCTDTRVRDFLTSFLGGYSYPSARAWARTRLAKEKIYRAVFPDPAGLLRSAGMAAALRYGIPQGSAVSCVLANAVLRFADLACLAKDPNHVGLQSSYR